MNSLFSKIGMLVLILVKTIFINTVTSRLHVTSTSQQQNAIGALIDKITFEDNIASYNIRFLTLSSSDADIWLNTFGKSHALITGDVKSLQFDRPIFAIFLLEENVNSTFTYNRQQFEFHNLTLHWIKALCHRQRDRFIFFGKKNSILKLWNIREINQLRHRWGYTIDSLEFMSRNDENPFDPLFFANIEQYPVAPYKIASNIRGRHLKLSGWAHVPPYAFSAGTDKEGNPIYDGSNVRLFTESCLIFNFTFELYSDEEAGSYGQLLENGSWTGMVGAVNSGAYDAALFIGPSLVWYPMFDFAGSLSGAAILYMTPRPTSEIRWQAFLHPFRLTVWISLVCLFMLVLICILLLIYSTAYLSLSKYTSKTSPVVSSTFLTFQIAMEQSAKIPHDVRIVCGAWLIFSIIVGTAYKSQVMSSLTFPFTEKPPNTYLDLANHKDYKSILNNIGGLEVAYFQSNDSQLIHTIAKTMTYEPVPIDCIKKAVLNPKTVCIGWFPFLEYIMAEWASPDAKIAPSTISIDPAMQVVVTVAFQKYSPFSEGFTPVIHAFWESGIYHLWDDDVLRIHKNKGVSNFKANPNTPLNKRLKFIIDDIAGGNGEKPLQLSNFKMMFGILASGVCAAISIFMSEQLLYQISKRSNLTKITFITVHSAFTIG